MVTDPCSLTTIIPESQSPISIAVWDQETLYPFTSFKDSASIANNEQNLCPKTYSSSVSTNAGGNQLTSFIVDASTGKFKVSSQAYNQIGTFIVTLTGTVAAYPSIIATTTLTVTVTDPCLKT